MGRLGNHLHVVTVHDVGDENDVVRPSIVAASTWPEATWLACWRLRRTAWSFNRRGGADRRARLCSRSSTRMHRDRPSCTSRRATSGSRRTAPPSWATSGRLVATDPALAITTDGMMLWMVAYMPPEQVLAAFHVTRARTSTRSARCCMRWSPARPLFAGEDAVAVISQHIITVPVTPSWHNREVPRPLDDLIFALLEKAPGRPAAGRQRRARALCAMRPLHRLGLSNGLPSEALRVAGRTATTFVGREHELGALRAAVDDAVARRGSLRMVVGEPGIGKTRLAGQVGVYARMRGVQPLTGRCYEGDGGIPYMPWVEALRAYVHAAPGRGAASGARELRLGRGQARPRGPRARAGRVAGGGSQAGPGALPGCSTR